MENMPDSLDYRMYLEKSFEGLHDKLDVIKEQTTKTNSRVNHLEDDVDILRERLVLHPVECSKAKDIEALKDDLIEYKIIKRYPKATAMLIAFFVISLLISAYGTFSTMRSNFNAKATNKVIDTINVNTR